MRKLDALFDLRKTLSDEESQDYCDRQIDHILSQEIKETREECDVNYYTFRDKYRLVTLGMWATTQDQAWKAIFSMYGEDYAQNNIELIIL